VEKNTRQVSNEKKDKKSVRNCQLSAHLILKAGTYKIITILPNIPIRKHAVGRINP